MHSIEGSVPNAGMIVKRSAEKIRQRRYATCSLRRVDFGEQGVMKAEGESQHMNELGSSKAKSKRSEFITRRLPNTEDLHRKSKDLGWVAVPALRDRRTQLLLLITALVQAFAWHQSNGYQLADSVEFMDRAYTVANGLTLDSEGIVRGFGFSTLLLPIFTLAEWLDYDNMREFVHVVRGLQMALGLALVHFTSKLGARLGGRQVGFVAGYFVAINPIFLQYSTDPVSGIAAASFLAISLNWLIARRGFWKSLAGGLMLGLSFIMAYQIILIAAPLLGLIMLRDRFKYKRAWLGANLGMALALGAQVALDKVMYDVWGLTIRTYFIENTGGVFFTFIAFIGLEGQAWVKDAYETYAGAISADAVTGENAERMSLQSVYFYFFELPKMLVYPVMAMGVLGLVQACRKMNWKSSIMVVLLLINVYIMSLKGSKSFRLWLPLLPLIAPICAWGWGSLIKSGEVDRPVLWRRATAVLVLVSGLVLGVRAMNQLNTRSYGVFWKAMDFVNAEVARERQEAEARGEAPKLARVASSYNWAVFCRNSADIEMVKFQAHLDQWHTLDEEKRNVVIEQLRECDWLMIHSTMFPYATDLTEAINKGYEVVAAFWDKDTSPAIRDVRIMRRLRLAPEAPKMPPGRHHRRLWAVLENADPEQYRHDWQLDHFMPNPALFVGSGIDGREERLQLLGFQHESLPGAGFGWVTYHWYTDTGFDHNYVLVDRIATRQSVWASQHNRQPAHGALPTHGWKPGTIVRESYIFMPGNRPFEEDFEAMGGSFRRGDFLPSMLWVRGESPPPDINLNRLLPADYRTGELYDINLAEPWNDFGLRMPEGQVLSKDALALVARFLLPVNPLYRWPDDGRPGPDDLELQAAHDLQQSLLEELRLAEEAESSAQ
ncbi:MAG: hypothetical protein ACI8X5_001119 [Planctomycetota bacterium]|jgi:hypothetical protein